MRSLIIIVAAAAAGGLLVAIPRHSPARRDGDGAEGLPDVTVTMLGTLRQVKGLVLPKSHRTEGAGLPSLLRPHRLTIVMPDGGGRVTLVARSMSLLGILDRERIEDVYVRRPLQPVRFNGAVADLRRTMKEMGVEPDNLMREQMATWPEDTPGVGEGGIPYDFKTGTGTPFAGIHLDIQVSPDPVGGWYYLLMFGATPEARRAARDAHKP